MPEGSLPEARRGLSLLCPHRFLHGGVTDLSPETLKSAGIRGVLVDLDNTLVGWQRADMGEPAREWIRSLKDAGLGVCLLSNTRSGRRLRQLSEELGVPFVPRPGKPARRGFVAAIRLLGLHSHEVAMVGDQMFTDVLGANRVGLFTVMVPPLAHREFFGTKISRAFEKVLMAHFRRKGMLKR